MTNFALNVVNSSIAHAIESDSGAMLVQRIGTSQSVGPLITTPAINVYLLTMKGFDMLSPSIRYD
jgi:hypothetical protein